MLANLWAFLIQWAVTALSLWVASHVFKGVRFADTSSLVVSALLLGFVNAVLRPILIVLTLPLTLLSFGLFLLVLNALLLMLVSKLIRGFSLSGFWTAFFASIFITVLGLLLGIALFGGELSWNAPLPMRMHPDWV
ncbi:MAG TPA: phage holin family protein [Rubrivivax sp.]|nr:phage holin family protein [Rubrivivax sp.]HPO21184.1 phage holin family protein [Rubrivivax sp.]